MYFVWYVRTGEVLQRISMPLNVNGIAFGGPNLDILFVPAEKIAFNLLSGEQIGGIDGGQGTVLMITGHNATGFPTQKMCIQ